MCLTPPSQPDEHTQSFSSQTLHALQPSASPRVTHAPAVKQLPAASCARSCCRYFREFSSGKQQELLALQVTADDIKRRNVCNSGYGNTAILAHTVNLPLVLCSVTVLLFQLVFSSLSGHTQPTFVQPAAIELLGSGHLVQGKERHWFTELHNAPSGLFTCVHNSTKDIQKCKHNCTKHVA